MLAAKQITDDLRKSFRGRLAFDPLVRGVYSADASPFRILPHGVAFPEDAEDLATLVKYAFKQGLSLIPRGAGTGVAGESLGPGLVVDLSARFRAILDITDDTARVQPGVTLAELNAKLAEHGRRFAPDPASAASCTLGGMIATNASGGTAHRHGTTRDHLAAVTCVWDDGTTSNDESRTAAIRAAAEALIATHRSTLDAHPPRTRFDRCGYRLHDALANGALDLARAVAGSEGTLAFVTEATLRTVPIAGGTSLVLLGFPSLESALNAALELRELDPVGCDLLDRRLLASTRAPALVAAALVVAFETDTVREALERGAAAIDKLKENHRLLVLAEPAVDPAGLAAIRSFRKEAVDGLYGLGAGPRPLAFIEDVGVPVEALPEFIAKAQDALQSHELSASFLVHALTGQIHTRPMVDLESPEHREKLWPLAEAVHAIAIALGGTVTSQHGTGVARTPWVERQSGPLFNLYREWKRIFDPKNILNPGKIVGPDPSRPAWPLREPEPAKDRVPLLVWKDEAPPLEAKKCTGCGECRPHSPLGRMCPAFRAEGIEEASPRAMSRLIELAPGDSLADDASFFLARKCINCKMCRDECPAHVNVPKMMLEAKAARHADHGLERADWFLAKTEGLAWLGSKFAPLVNRLLARPGFRWMVEKALGVSRRRRLPSFAWRNFTRRARKLGLTKRGDSGAARKVAYFVDVFANYNDPSIAEATVAVLRHNGVEVFVPPRQVGCGASPLAVGDIETAREAALRNVRALADLVRDGYRVVCSEPTAALMLAQDYPDFLDDPDVAALASNTVELTTYLGEMLAAGELKSDFGPLDLTLGHHVPCHLKALRGPARGPELLARIPGVQVRTIDVSCSGMGGTWGLKAANYETSLAAGRRMIEEVNRSEVAFGSSECSACRMQMQEGSGKRALHPIQYLALSYGLMPELGRRLKRPLDRRVSE